MAISHEYRSDPFYRMTLTLDRNKVFWGFVQGAKHMGSCASIEVLAAAFLEFYSISDVTEEQLRYGYNTMNEIVIDMRRKV